MIDHSIRTGEILPRLPDIQRAGSSFDKQFAGGKSKKDAIPRLMAKLVEFPIGDLNSFYATWKQEARKSEGTDTEYDDLAQFLIKGAKGSQSPN